MGWSIGFDNNWNRDIGYGVPAYCDHPKCNAEINRGLSYVCGGEPYGGDRGCGLYFCDEHGGGRLCPRCEARRATPYKHPKSDHPRWIHHKLTDESWQQWRDENPAEVERMKSEQAEAKHNGGCVTENRNAGLDAAPAERESLAAELTEELRMAARLFQSASEVGGSVLRPISYDIDKAIVLLDEQAKTIAQQRKLIEMIEASEGRRMEELTALRVQTRDEKLEELIRNLTEQAARAALSPYAERYAGLDEAGDKLREYIASLRSGVQTPDADTFDFLAHLHQQRRWSEQTFGPGPRTAGVLDHIRKELREIEADPTDLAEWIDVVILALDGAWRAGYLPNQIIRALREKQARNESRTWPDWRTAAPDKAIEHVRTCGHAWHACSRPEFCEYHRGRSCPDCGATRAPVQDGAQALEET